MNIHKKFYGLLFVVAFFCLGVSFVFSQTPIKGQGVTISPYLSELDLNPGDVKNLSIKLTNPTDSLMELYPKVMNFGASGEGGDPTFYSATEENRGYSMAHWISFEQTKIAILPNQVVDFNCKLEVPGDAEPGGHYGVMFFSTEPPKIEEKTSAVAIASMTGSLILARISGNTQEDGLLEEFSVPKKLYWKTPVDFTLRIKNEGNVHFRPKGNISVNDIFGRDAGKIIINSKTGNILPDSVRKFEEKFESDKILIGPFSAKLRVIYGNSEKTLDGKVNFWIVPWWSLAVLGVVVFIIIFLLIRRIIKKRRNKNNYFGGGTSGGARKNGEERVYFEEKRPSLRMPDSQGRQDYFGGQGTSHFQNRLTGNFSRPKSDSLSSKGSRRVV